MDYNKLVHFNKTYKELSDEYKNQLNELLSNSFNLDEIELHDFSIIMGYTLDDKIICTMSLLKHDDLKKILSEKDNEDMKGYSKKGDGGLFIYNIITDKNYRRLNLGERLLRHLIDNCDNDIKYLHCQVERSNEPSFNLFFKCRFQIEDDMIDSNKNIISVMARYIDLGYK